MSHEADLIDVAADRFSGKTILIVEDEAIVSFLIEDTLAGLGAVIWNSANLDDALQLLSERVPDIAVLDVNLAGRLVFPVAERLESAGIPFVFATGYGRMGIPAAWSERAVVQKPFEARVLLHALSAALGD
jgi:CheY-like chemotaxis protein